MSDVDRPKLNLWMDFLATQKVTENSVPLFITERKAIVTMTYGRNQRVVLKRSSGKIDALMGHLNRQLIDADLFGVPDPDNIPVARPDFLPLGPEGHALGARISGFDPERTKQSLSGLNGQAVHKSMMVESSMRIPSGQLRYGLPLLEACRQHGLCRFFVTW